MYTSVKGQLEGVECQSLNEMDPWYSSNEWVKPLYHSGDDQTVPPLAELAQKRRLIAKELHTAAQR